MRILLIATALALLTMSGAFAQDAPLDTPVQTQYRNGPERSGAFDSPALRETPSLRWQFPLRRPARMTPAVADGTVFIGGEDGRLFALDAASGEQRWLFEVGASTVSSPAVRDGRLYLGSLNGSFYALDAATGQELWRFETEGEIYSSPLLVEDALYFGSRDRNVYALTLDGTLLWRTSTDGEVWSSPAYRDGLVYVGSTDGQLHALDAATGEERWTTEVGSTRATPVIADDLVFMTGGENRLSALDAETGALLGQTQVGERGIEASLTVQGDRVFTIGLDGTLGAFTFDRTSLTWQMQWAQNIGGPAYSSPSSADDTVYVITEAGGLLYAFDAGTGEELWRYQTGAQGDWRAASPVLVDGVLYISSNTDGMLALESQESDS